MRVVVSKELTLRTSGYKWKEKKNINIMTLFFLASLVYVYTTTLPFDRHATSEIKNLNIGRIMCSKMSSICATNRKSQSL